MGIVNATPDSFSDGGQHADAAAAIEHACRLLAEGAYFIDVGGESSRPGAATVSLELELARVLPVVSGLRHRADVPISIDTTKAEVARQALAAGADIINDISGLTADAAMAEVVAETGAGVVLMHRRGLSATMQAEANAAARDPARTVDEVFAWFAHRLAELAAAGVASEQICLDAGLGFGKTDAENLALLCATPHFATLGRPVLVGLSRKSMLGRITGREVPERGAASVAADACAVLCGAAVLRVHDVAASLDAARVAQAVRDAGAGWPP